MHYPWPSFITLDHSSKFIGQDFRDMCVNDHGIKRKVILTQNPQANAIIERAHQMLGNLIRSFQLQDLTMTQMTLGEAFLQP
jgi:transposase InsO family protein